jgi:hypothetical protein
VETWKFWASPALLLVLIFGNEQYRGKLDRRLGELVSTYSRHASLSQLGRGLVESITDMFELNIPQEDLEMWQAAWESASIDHEELEIPVRLLRAAVAWKHSPDPRILLGLPPEERGVLEELLPKAGDYSE